MTNLSIGIEREIIGDIRCASNQQPNEPGVFAISYVNQSGRVLHSRIINDLEGYHFENRDVYFPNLTALVEAFRSTLVLSYMDPNRKVLINVSGRVFETRASIFFNVGEFQRGFDVIIALQLIVNVSIQPLIWAAFSGFRATSFRTRIMRYLRGAFEKEVVMAC